LGGPLGLFAVLDRPALLARRFGGFCLAGRCRRLFGDGFLGIFVVPLGNIAFLFGALNFLMVGGKNFFLEFFAAHGVDGMGYVCVEFRAASFIPGAAVALEPRSAFVAVIGADVVFAAAFLALLREFAAGHGHKRPGRPFDDLEIPDHKVVAYRDAAKCLQLLRLIIH
jgi:hypothetical protein